MGRFIVRVDAMGNHGCMREIKDGEVVIGCDRQGCVDCITREYVRRLKRYGSSTVDTASITHWPDTAGTVIDDLVTGKRTGSF